MKEIIIIAAVSKNKVIGKYNYFPWHIKKDLEHFEKLTLNNTVVYGRRVFESIDSKPLKNRTNIMLTKNPNLQPKGVIVKHSLKEALDSCEGKIFICGGYEIYKEGLQIADKLELTIIDKEFEGDTFFPEINFDEWELTNKENHVDEKHGKYSFCTYVRKKI